MENFNINEVSNLVERAIKSISDSNNLIWHSPERNICHHIATALKVEFPNFHVDVELEKDDRRRPDIVIHEMGTNENNLIAFEVKINPSYSDIAKDLEKINNTFFRDPYFYEFGIFISIGKLPAKLPLFNKEKIGIVEVYGSHITY